MTLCLLYHSSTTPKTTFNYLWNWVSRIFQTPKSIIIRYTKKTKKKTPDKLTHTRNLNIKKHFASACNKKIIYKVNSKIHCRVCVNEMNIK